MRALVVVALLVASCNNAKPIEDEVAEWAEQACQCKDRECGDKAMKRYVELANRATASGDRPTKHPELDRLVDKANACLIALD